MMVILRENVEHLGQIGDLVKVSDGFARNYLLPRKLVAIANENNVAQVEHQKKMLEKKRQALRSTAEELAKQLGEFSCTVERKVGENDKLFGSVTSADIQVALKKAGFAVEKRWIQLGTAIKSLGVYTVSVRLAPEVTTEMKVWVVKEGSAKATTKKA